MLLIKNINIKYKFINPLWPSDTILQYRFGSTLVQVMACCHQAFITWTNVDLPSKFSVAFNWDNFTRSAHDINS